jgi:hypothetical protein
MGTYLEMSGVVKFVIDKLTPKYFVSKFVQKTKFKIGVSLYFCDNDWAGNSEN